MVKAKEEGVDLIVVVQDLRVIVLWTHFREDFRYSGYSVLLFVFYSDENLNQCEVKKRGLVNRLSE